MGEDPSTSSAPVTESQDPEQIQREIEQTREQLGDTVEALAHKTDVKAQAKQKIEDAKTKVSGKKDELLGKAKDGSPDAAVSIASRASEKARQNPAPLAVVAAFAAGFLTARAFGK